ncbi:hypothetical protein JTB14_023513, partial [Gonioctena quinquepunctata]
ELATYPGGGYVATLGKNWRNSVINTNYIFHNNWIDRYTRGLFFEFLVYSPNGNLFHSVRVAFEVATTGLVFTLFQVQTAHLLFVVNESSARFQVVVAFFILMVGALLIKLLYKIGKKRKLVFKDLWTLADIIIISLSIACITLFVERATTVRLFLNEIENAKPNEFINYFHLLSSQTTMTVLAAVLVFISTLRLWKLLRFMSIIKISEKTLGLSLPRFSTALVYQMLFIYLFQLLGRLLFENDREFRNDQDSFMTLTLLALNFLKTYDFTNVKTHSQRLYFCVYLLASYFFLTSFVAVISACYGDAQIYYSNQEGYSVFDYLSEQYQYYKVLGALKVAHIRQRGGQDGSTSAEEQVVFPKADKHRYAKCLKIPQNKMNMMWHLTRGILRNMKPDGTHMKPDGKLEENDENLMGMIIANMMRTDQKEENYFFVGSSESEKAIFVDDFIFKRMEKISNSLLSKKEKMYRQLFKINDWKFREIEKKLSDASNLLGRTETFRVIGEIR